MGSRCVSRLLAISVGLPAQQMLLNLSCGGAILLLFVIERVLIGPPPEPAPEPGHDAGVAFE